MSQTLTITFNEKAQSVSLRGRNMNATYPANGFIVASANTNVNDTIDFTLPGSVILEEAVPRNYIENGNTGGKFGATVALAVTNLNDNYLDGAATLNAFDDVFYDAGTTSDGEVLQWNVSGWVAGSLTSSDVGALPSTAVLDDLADTDVGSKNPNDVLTWDGSDWIASAPSGGGATDMDGLTDADTTGIATGDGMKYDGSGFVAGKWGVGTEDQVIGANLDNQGAAGSTRRTITLDTQTTFPSMITSSCVLDLVDGAGNTLESVQSLEINSTGTPTYVTNQQKFGALIVKKSGSGTAAQLGFNNQYASGGNTMYLRCDNVASPWALNLPSTGSSTAGQVMQVAASSTASQTNLEWATPSGGGGGSNYVFNDQGRRQWSATQDNHYNIGDSSFGIYDNSESYNLTNVSGTGTADLLMFNGFTMPADMSSIDFVGHANTFSSNIYGEDLEIKLWRIRHTSGDDCSVDEIGTQTVTLGSVSGDVASFDFSGSTNMPLKGDVILTTYRLPNATMTATCYVRYGYTLVCS